MNRTFEYQINEENTIRDFLKKKGYSKPILTSIKYSDCSLFVNEKPAMLFHTLKPNDTLRVNIKEAFPSEHILPVNLPLSIVFEDEDLIVVNKPANMPIHPSIKNYDNTLANALAYYYAKEDSPFVFRCMNRLDKDTTGLTVIAKNPFSAAILSRSMKNREFIRIYYAGVKGHPLKVGTIQAPIARESDSIITRKVDYENGQPAITHYEVITYGVNYSLIKLKLETGRTHQIRVHMKHLGHPLPGDFIYCPDFTDIKRQALHAKSLSFPHPITGKQLYFDTDIPADIMHLLEC
ncbi:MAG: RluA family pseudouridine synthase [Lachnospiraceae bacterium]|jgi:23S rRNA pseudouridine1911/1915/1917 synthase|nr:RluA family pseudouridine synthase [Lachnospiraceae bacterium]